MYTPPFPFLPRAYSVLSSGVERKHPVLAFASPTSALGTSLVSFFFLPRLPFNPCHSFAVSPTPGTFPDFLQGRYGIPILYFIFAFLTTTPPREVILSPSFKTAFLPPPSKSNYLSLLSLRQFGSIYQPSTSIKPVNTLGHFYVHLASSTFYY